MKKLLVSILVCFVFQQIVFGKDSADSVKSVNQQPNVPKAELIIEGVQVYGNNGLLNNEQVLNKLKACPVALDIYQSGKNMRVGGVVLIFSGAISIPFGLRTMLYGALKSGFSGKEDPDYFIGACLFYGGMGMIGGGIVCHIRGGKKIRRAIDVYNTSLYQSYLNTQASCQLGLLDNGNIGLRLNF